MRRALRWIVVAWVAGEWWTRGGREVMLGPRRQEPGGMTEFTTWTMVAHPEKVKVGDPIMWKQHAVGEVSSVNGGVVHGRFQKALMAWPIHRGVSEAKEALRLLGE